MGLILLCPLLMTSDNDALGPRPLGARVVSTVTVRVQRGILSLPAWRVNQDNFNRIEKGMTKDQVQALLGGPPGWYTLFSNPPTCIFRRRGGYFENGSVVPAVDEEWASDAGTILLRFKRGKVTLRAFAIPDGDWLGDDEPALDFD